MHIEVFSLGKKMSMLEKIVMGFFIAIAIAAVVGLVILGVSAICAFCNGVECQECGVFCGLVDNFCSNCGAALPSK